MRRGRRAKSGRRLPIGTAPHGILSQTTETAGSPSLPRRRHPRACRERRRPPARNRAAWDFWRDDRTARCPSLLRLRIPDRAGDDDGRTFGTALLWTPGETTCCGACWCRGAGTTTARIVPCIASAHNPRRSEHSVRPAVRQTEDSTAVVHCRHLPGKRSAGLVPAMAWSG